MSDRSNLFRLVHLPPDLAQQLRDSVEEAFSSLGGATAELILHYARRSHNVNVKDLPLGIEELDAALKDILGTGRRMVVNHCAEILSRRLGKDVKVKTEKLADVFRMVVKIYEKRGPVKEDNSTLFGEPQTFLPNNYVD